MPELWAWLQTTNASASLKAAVLTAMVTGHRISVIVNAEWSDIDLRTSAWTVPERDDKATPGRMKSGRSYSLKLPKELVQLFTTIKSDRASGNADVDRFVFASPIKRSNLTPNAVLKILKGFDPSLTTHGFRNSIKEFCRITTPPIPDHIADAFCDHSLKGLDASYRRRDTSEERAELAERLMAYVTSSAVKPQTPTHT